MPYRNRNQIDVTNKAGPEFDHWLKSNVSDDHHRNWYRSDTVARQTWQDKLEQQMYQDRLDKIRREKWKQRW